MRIIVEFIRNIFSYRRPELEVSVAGHRFQIRNVLISLFLAGFFILCLVLILPHNDTLKIQIIFVSLVYIFIALPLTIRASRNRIFSILGFENYSRWKFIIISVSLFLLLLPFTLYVLTSVPNSPIRPEGIFNPYYLIPDSFRFYLIAISATLGGLVLTASNNDHLDSVTRREFINVSKKFIVATILLILFVVFFYNSNIFGNVDPTKFEGLITIQGAYIFVMFWASVFCFYLGVILFLVGIIELIISLSNVSLRE